MNHTLSYKIKQNKTGSFYFVILDGIFNAKIIHKSNSYGHRETAVSDAKYWVKSNKHSYAC
jgi:uncharacterized protein YegP (UPF0339 family)